ncbi:MAG: tRNA (adenosine(37)-N6)-threonylcarbamoyltransferase complex dimerization subunit type 1 TsaB [Armatimonadota bacterium]|nr:tRNA (adenosine(37)-N6)-threonylcarbamoyltransferase complex dimerization subunit type 1 TsaB [Armatimonadota bacterium]
MRILGIETSSATSSVALVEDGEVIRERSFPSRMTLNQRLAGHVRTVVDGADLTEAELDAVAVGVGPGSFTGVRMGVALGKAIAHALELPLVGVSAPEAIASALQRPAGSAVCVLQRARADEVYATALRIGEEGIVEEIEETRVLTLPRALRTAEELLGRPPDVLCGTGAAQFADAIRSILPEAELCGEEQSLPGARDVALVAAGRAGPDRRQAAFSLTPRYVRLSQAEREFGVDLGLSGGDDG